MISGKSVRAALVSGLHRKVLVSAHTRATCPPALVPTLRRAAREPLFGGRYQILRQLGAGASSIVLAAFDLHLRREIALKLLCPGYQLEALREARAMSLVSHPNVLEVYDAGTIRGAAYLTMELIRGTTLREWAHRPRSAREVIWAMTYAGRGLAAAHASGIVHRDFKPANILVDHRGTVKVGDFGIAARTPRGAEDSGTRMGTEPYMAPEVALGRSACARSDQFSFCATLYELLAREPLFASGSAADAPAGTVELRLRQLRRRSLVPGGIPSGRRLVPAGVPPSWRHVRRPLLRVLARGLAFDPDVRYSTMNQLLADLECTLQPQLPPHMPMADALV